MFIPDPGSEFFHPESLIQGPKDPGSASKNLSMIQDVHRGFGSRIRIPPPPPSRSSAPDPDLQLWFHIFVQEVGLLVSFYTDRLKDHHSVLPSTLRGLACLARTHSLDTSQLETLLDR
jgi:hypothetical protein